MKSHLSPAQWSLNRVFLISVTFNSVEIFLPHKIFKIHFSCSIRKSGLPPILYKNQYIFLEISSDF